MKRWVALGTTALTLLGGPVPSVAAPPTSTTVAGPKTELRSHKPGHAAPLRATIRRTRYGVPHVRARDLESLTFGFAYAYAEDNFCTIARAFVTFSGERSRWFGPEGSWTFGANGETYKNLDSDFFFAKLNQSGQLERLLAQPPPLGPVEGVEKAVAGYVRGYNEFLRRRGRGGIGDERCEGEPWVRPITKIDAYRLFHQFALAASSGAAIGGIGGAAPLLGPAAAAARRSQRRALTAPNLGSSADPRRLTPDLGSNAYAFGSQATKNRKGALLGNPHFPWDGPERQYQVHLTIPGRLDVQGLTIFGVPMVLMGWNREFAWTHTVATAYRFTPYGLILDPADPHRYLVDGEFREMEPTTVTVDVRTPPGAVEQRSRTLYDTIWGPVVDQLPGLPMPWTPAVAFALADVNADNIRYLNHFLLGAQVERVSEYDALQRRFQGVPSVNSIATDRTGAAYYTMQGAIPNVSDEMALACAFPGAGQAAFTLVGLPILDGSRSACRWPDDPAAVAPGIMPPERIPTLVRRDYVHNGNDSHWLTNPDERLEGFDRIVGTERTERSWRTRIGLIMAEQRLTGTDGLPGKSVTRKRLQAMAFGNRQYLGELWREPLVELCSTLPVMVSTSGSAVDVRGACAALRGWDLRDDLDSNGALLFRRFATNLLATFRELPSGSQGVTRPGAQSLYTRLFSPADPVGTPAGLNVANPLVQAALADAVADLEGIGAPLDAPLRGWQYDVRGGKRIPIHGGPGRLGVFNAISAAWDPAGGYADVRHGTGLIFAVGFRDRGCPVEAGTLLAYSQSDNPDSEHASDYSRAYSRKRWHRAPFCAQEIRRDPELEVKRIREGG